jgi:hypothetical protein
MCWRGDRAADAGDEGIRPCFLRDKPRSTLRICRAPFETTLINSIMPRNRYRAAAAFSNAPERSHGIWSRRFAVFTRPRSMADVGCRPSGHGGSLRRLRPLQVVPGAVTGTVSGRVQWSFVVHLGVYLGVYSGFIRSSFGVHSWFIRGSFGVHLWSI